MPLPALRGQPLEGQPAPVPGLDGILTAASGQEPEDVTLEESGVHSEVERDAAAKLPAQGVDRVPQEGEGLGRVVHIARPILERAIVESCG